MGAISQQSVVAGAVRVVGNSSTPPTGYAMGQLGAPVHSGAGTYQIPTLDGSTPVALPAQEYEAKATLEGAVGQISVTWASPDANHITVHTAAVDGTAADRDFQLTVSHIRVPASAG
jgi:hypothetical protein